MRRRGKIYNRGVGRRMRGEGEECMNRYVHVHPHKMTRDAPCPTWHPKIWAVQF